MSQGAKPADVAQVLFSSDERHKILVAQLYQKDLHRDVDAAGLAFWTTALKQGEVGEQVQTALLSADEYFSRLS